MGFIVFLYLHLYLYIPVHYFFFFLLITSSFFLRLLFLVSIFSSFLSCFFLFIFIFFSCFYLFFFPFLFISQRLLFHFLFRLFSIEPVAASLFEVGENPSKIFFLEIYRFTLNLEDVFIFRDANQTFIWISIWDDERISDLSSGLDWNEPNLFHYKIEETFKEFLFPYVLLLRLRYKSYYNSE